MITTITARRGINLVKHIMDLGKETPSDGKVLEKIFDKLTENKIKFGSISVHNKLIRISLEVGQNN